MRNFCNEAPYINCLQNCKLSWRALANSWQFLCRFNSAVFARKHPCVSRLVFGNPVTDDILLSVLEVMGEGEGGTRGGGQTNQSSSSKSGSSLLHRWATDKAALGRKNAIFMWQFKSRVLYCTYSTVVFCILTICMISMIQYGNRTKLVIFLAKIMLKTSVPDPWRSDMDPDPRICTNGIRIWIRIFSLVAFKMPTKKVFPKIFGLLLSVSTFTSVFKDNK